MFSEYNNFYYRGSQESGPDSSDSFPPIPPAGFPQDTARSYGEDQALVPMAKERFPKWKKKLIGFIAGLMSLSLVMGVGGGMLASSLLNSGGQSNNSKGVVYQSVIKTSASSGSVDMSVADVADAASDAVVEITTETVTMGGRMNQYVSEGAGSGVIITSDGYIVTNNHVIDGAEKITVRTTDGAEYSATVIGTDSKTDLAVVKIDKSGLTAAVFGDSDSLTVGEAAVAIGNPLGELGGTVTEGIVSALDRKITIDGESMSLLQTSAAINPGNSGGGLFNAAGELIGIVNAKSSGTGIEGLGFAIPSNTVKSISEQLIMYGYVKGRVDTGLTLVDISDTQTARMYRVQNTGVYVLQTTRNDTSFQSGDRIISVNGGQVGNSSEFSAAIENYVVGDAVSVVIERNGSTVTVQMILYEMVNG